MKKSVTVLALLGLLSISAKSSFAVADDLTIVRFPEAFAKGSLPRVYKDGSGRLNSIELGQSWRCYSINALWGAASAIGGQREIMRFSDFYRFIQNDNLTPEEEKNAPWLAKPYAELAAQNSFVRNVKMEWRFNRGFKAPFTMFESLRMADGRLLIERSATVAEVMPLIKEWNQLNPRAAITNVHPSLTFAREGLVAYEYAVCEEVSVAVPAMTASTTPIPSNPSLPVEYTSKVVNDIGRDFAQGVLPTAEDLKEGETWNCSPSWALNQLAHTAAETPGLRFKWKGSNTVENILKFGDERNIVSQTYKYDNNRASNRRELAWKPKRIFQVDYKQHLVNGHKGTYADSYEAIRKVSGVGMTNEDYLIIERSISVKDMDRFAKAYQDYLQDPSFKLSGPVSQIDPNRIAWHYVVCGKTGRIDGRTPRPLGFN